MLRALWSSSTGMKAQMTNLDVIANNLANVNTVGFKKSRADFQDLLYETLKAAGESTGPDSRHPVGQQIGVGTKLSAITKEHSQGSATRTDRDLDIAIMGKGFLQITGFEGETLYTRDGALQVDSAGNVVTSTGLSVIGVGAVPEDARGVNFGPTGLVTYIDPAGNENDIGQIELVTFLNPSGLNSLGGNLYSTSPSSGTALPNTPGQNSTGTIQQHYLELSNVSIVEEMVNMITAQRAYEVNSKMIKASDQMLATANQIAR